MKRPICFALVAALGGGAMLLLAGCESTGAQRMANARDGHVMACQKCYDEVKIIVQHSGKGAQLYPSRIIKKQVCPDCNTETMSYTQDGKTMFKCSKCAPQGIACGKCLPPKAKS